MLVQADLEVLDALTQVLQDLRDDGSPLMDIFGSRPAPVRDEVIQFFGQHIVPVYPGFPRALADLPGYYVSLGSSREDTQPLGSLVENESDLPAGIREREGSTFASMVRVSCIAADNANLPIWMSEVARWGLLRYRDILDDRGLVQQTLSFSDFEPMPTWFPTLAFRRDALLSVTHFATVERLVPALRGITVQAAEPIAPSERFTASIRR